MLSRFSRTLHQFPKHSLPCWKNQDVRLLSDISPVLGAEPVEEVVKQAVSVLPDPNFYNIVGHYQVLLDTIQQTSGLPWWALLIGTGLVLRSSCAVWNIPFEKKHIKRVPHFAALAEIQIRLTTLTAKGDTIGALTAAEEVKYYKKKHNFSWKNSANWWLLPNMMAMTLNFFAIRQLAEMPYQALLDTSFLWLPDLCQRDPYFIIPAANAVAVCYVMKYGIDMGNNKVMEEMFSNNYVLGGMIVAMGAIQSYFPAALLLYWFSSNIIGMALIGPALRNDNFRSRVGLISMEEKREVCKVLPSLGTLQNDMTQGYEETRKEAHRMDMEEKKKRLDNLKNVILDSEENLDVEDLDEMKKQVNEMKNRLNKKRIDLEKLKKETDEFHYLKEMHKLQMDMEGIKKETNSEEDLDEENLNKMRNELNQKRLYLEKLTKETDEIEKNLEEKVSGPS